LVKALLFSLISITDPGINVKFVVVTPAEPMVNTDWYPKSMPLTVAEPGPVMVKFEATPVPIVMAPVAFNVMPDEIVIVAVKPLFNITLLNEYGSVAGKLILTLELITAISPDAKPG